MSGGGGDPRFLTEEQTKALAVEGVSLLARYLPQEAARQVAAPSSISPAHLTIVNKCSCNSGLSARLFRILAAIPTARRAAAWFGPQRTDMCTLRPNE